MGPIHSISVATKHFPERGRRSYNRERSRGNSLLITIFFHVSSPVLKIEDLIDVIKQSSEERDKTLLASPSSSKVKDFLDRLKEALPLPLKERSEEKSNNVHLGRFKKVVFDVANQDITASVKAWALAVFRDLSPLCEDVSSPVLKIQDLINAIEHDASEKKGTTLPAPLSASAVDFVKRERLKKALTKEKSDNIDLGRFTKVVVDVAHQEITARALAVWVR